MKYFFLLIAIIAGVAACQQAAKGSNGVVYKSAVQYSDYIVGRQNIIINNIINFVQVSKTDLDSAGKMLDKYVMDITGSITDIKGMPPYKGDTSFRNAAIHLFQFYKKVFGNEYKRLIEIRQNHGETTSEGVAEMNGIVEKITKEEEGYDKIFHNAQKDFAEKNNLRLSDNEMQKKIDKIK